MNTIRILIADDHKLVREAWEEIFHRDGRFKVVGSFGNAEEAVQAAKSVVPDIVLMDINIEPYSGLEATQKIRKLSPLSHVIGVSFFAQPIYAKKIFQMGAKGYVTKNSPHAELIEAIIEVYNGNKYVCREIKQSLSDIMITETDQRPDIKSLTFREIEVANLINQGFSSKEIATHLNTALKTIEVHRHNILRKLHLRNSASLVNFVHGSNLFGG